MASAATFPVTVEEPRPSSFDHPILDIFDAPSRLGESSRLLALNAAASTSRPARPSSTHTPSRRPPVQPLPAPILLDGPARPRGMSFVSFRNHRPRTADASRSLDMGDVSLPPPVLFDGPSRLRPYVHGCSRGRFGSTHWAMSTTPLMLAVAAAAVLFGIDIEPRARSVE
ncbi:hypothetical protein C8Q80DRAFT_1267179 [Daedaleopsis nitida]|nr:hypothetical protein C8Q80DRAFT_1267179 [Daedaleopsis nitida]